MLLRSVLLLAVAAITRWSPIAATTYTINKFYSSTDVCSNVPNAVKAVESTDCSSVTCSRDANNDTVTTECQSDFLEAMRLSFGSSQYILQVIYDDNECSTFSYAVGYRVTGSCERGYVATESDYAALFYFTATLPDDGTAVLDFFATSDCSTTSESSNSSEIGDVHAPENILQDATCIAVDYSSYMYLNTGYCQWYSSNTYDNGGLGTAGVIGVVGGCVVVVLVIAAAVFYARRRSKSKRGGHWTVTGDLTALETAMNGQAGLWNDEVITTKRVSRDKVKVKKLISRGAYGEVYNGFFNGHQVAVKMLLPSTRGNLQHVTDFLTEAKMMASMDHPHIVTFVGVAWDSLSDLCVVLEFMDGGDLRTLLNKYEATKHPVGVNREKATIALHVIHALTYLHSLMPPVIHRDLKSRNILLNQSKAAKLTDFGASRKQLDQTMTAGVGTSLWMAPEVMLGDHYDVKADIFSFGVVFP